jgi:riboflavin kinase/FMN adenylyltransferase
VAFIEGTLMAGLDARWLLVGEDFRFGAKRAGDFAMLERAAAAHGVALEAMPSVRYEGTRVSSSAVRAALAGGDLARARALLGRSYSISGRVVHGDKLGRDLGFATANVQLKHNRPPFTGIFAVRVRGVRSTVCKGVASLGFRPTVKSDGRATLEVHLFDFSDELYGTHLQVEFIAKIRDEEKYPDLATLRAQIAHDCEVARTLHSQHA